MTEKNLESLFQRVAVISLERRPERWKVFLEKLPSSWPFSFPLRFPAIDGSLHRPPHWWREGPGAWGCYLSHVQLIKDALEDGIDSILILEDDAIFIPSFAHDVRQFVDALPEDWQYIFLGGQHIELHQGMPSRINQWVYRPHNVNRTHAYAIRGRTMLQRVYDHLVDVEHWTAKHHVDHHLGTFQKSIGSQHTYVPWKWLVAQGSGESDVAGSARGFRAFLNAEEIVQPKVKLPLVAVLGPYSGGTSAVAGILHEMGIPLGRTFEQPDGTNPAGNFESHELASMCRRMYAEPWLTEQLEGDTRVRLLKIWAAGHTQSFEQVAKLVGAKHPLLCLLGPELEEAWNRPKILSVQRDTSDVINSLVRRNWGWPLEACILASEKLIRSRELYLAAAQSPVLRVEYKALLQDPHREINAICTFLGVDATAAAKERASNFILSAGKSGSMTQ